MQQCIYNDSAYNLCDNLACSSMVLVTSGSVWYITSLPLCFCLEEEGEGEGEGEQEEEGEEEEGEEEEEDIRVASATV